MKTVRDILQKKGSDFWSISSEATIYEALQLMSEKDIGALLVIDNGKLNGIMSERDYARKVILLGKTSKETSVKEIMSKNVMYVQSRTTADECMALMTNKRVRHLPVYDDGKLTGLISIGDVVKALINEKEFVIDQLVHYITGTPPLEDKSKEQTEAPPTVY